MLAPIGSFSGGYRMRAKLLQAHRTQPNLMLLDEPTNYLDLETLMVLEKFLQGFGRSVSADLARSRISSPDDGSYLGSRSRRRHQVQRDDRRLFRAKRNAPGAARRSGDVARRKAHGRSSISSRALARRRRRQARPSRVSSRSTGWSPSRSKPLPVTAKIRIPPPARTGKMVLKLKARRYWDTEKRVLRRRDFAARDRRSSRGRRLNGAGKSTLLKGLAGRPTLLSGSIEYGYEVTFAFFNQHVAEDLNPDDTVLRALQRKAHSAVFRKRSWISRARSCSRETTSRSRFGSCPAASARAWRSDRFFCRKRRA